MPKAVAQKLNHYSSVGTQAAELDRTLDLLDETVTAMAQHNGLYFAADAMLSAQPGPDSYDARLQALADELADEAGLPRRR
jgi:hypothetical protein